MKITNLDLIELDNLELEMTKFYSSYSSMPFNKGIIFKRIGTQPSLILSNIVSELSKEINEVKIQNTGEIKRIKANNQIHDFVYKLLTHNDIYKKWRYNDDDFFTEFSIEFNSQESFREIGLLEIRSEDFISRLSSLCILGSCYGKMNYGQQEIRVMIQDFVGKLLTDPNDRVIVSTISWGKCSVGWFNCFFIIRKNDIIIFGQDDYD